MDFDLAKFRAEKGISLHEISTKLNIPEKFLLAIEELNFDELPAPIFAKSQIKKYICKRLSTAKSRKKNSKRKSFRRITLRRKKKI